MFGGLSFSRLNKRIASRADAERLTSCHSELVGDDNLSIPAKASSQISVRNFVCSDPNKLTTEVTNARSSRSAIVAGRVPVKSLLFDFSRKFCMAALNSADERALVRFSAKLSCRRARVPLWSISVPISSTATRRQIL